MEPQPAPLGPDDPRQIGEYRLRGVLGSGGMAKVYLGVSPGGRRFAIKVVHSVLAASPEFRDRFRREIEAARQLSGVYSPGVDSFDVDAPSPWMATRFINGRSLQERVDAEGPMPPEEARQIVLGLAEALHGIHRAGYVHRDIKPSNVVFDSDGPHVIDFGIIAKAAEESGLTGTGQVIGTPRYLAPERMAGDRATAASDMYSLGALLHFLLTGTTPTITGGRPDTAAIDDPHLAAVVRECLDLDPARRPTARELLGGLDLDGPPLVVTQPVPTQPVPSPAPTSPPPTSPPPTLPAPTSPPPTVLAPTAPPQTLATAATAPLVPQPVVPQPVVPQHPDQPPPDQPAWSRPPPERDRRRVVIGAVAAVLLLVIAGLGINALRGGDESPPGSASGSCPRLPTGEGLLSATGTAADGSCYGFTDGLGADEQTGFGRDPGALSLQRQLFAANRSAFAEAGAAPGTNDLTVVWLGSLSCPAYTAAGTCQDGRDYDAERQALQALLLSQRRTDLGGRIRVVIADAGADMRQARDVVRLLTARREALGRAVAIGGGDSRDVTKQAIDDLLDARVPFVAPTLTSDDDGPGLPFVNRDGYLQLSLPNQNQADAVVDFIAAHTPASARREVLVYHVPDAGDLYTTSLARDVQSAARSNPRTTGPARIISSPAQLPGSMCRSGDIDPPTAVVFVDRWNTFAPFADAVTRLCGTAGPGMVIGGDSVNRIMTNDAARAAVRAPWPIAYFTKGTQCSELTARAARRPSGEAALLLAAARRDLGACGGDGVQLGDTVSLVWDSVAVAALSTAPDASGQVRDGDLTGSVTDYRIRAGAVVWPSTATMTPLCVLTVDRTGQGGRSRANCTAAFPVR